MPQARPGFRRLALATSIACFLLAGIVALLPMGHKALAGGSSLVVGFVMLTISRTGYWPARAARRNS